MRCDPRVVSLKGIQVIDGTIENGNHLRAFVGVEHGFSEDVLTLYRRPSSDKASRIRSFNFPVYKDKQINSLLNSVKNRFVPIKIETNDPSLTLNARIKLLEIDQLATFEISFPSLVGYLEIRSSRPKLTTKIFGKLADEMNGSDILVQSGQKEGPSRPDMSTLTLRNYERTGMKIGKVASTLSRINDSWIGRTAKKIFQPISDIFKPQTPVKVMALYDGELVMTERSDPQGHVSLINVPLDEIRITLPFEYGFRVEFILMEEDAEKEGHWVKVEELPGPQTLLSMDDPYHRFHLFEKLLKERFWPDVQNRILMRPEATGMDGWERVRRFYGEAIFYELMELLNDIYDKQGWIQRPIWGSRVTRGRRGCQSVYALRKYDPEQLAFLITLTLDVNIATLVGLHTVDRGQHQNPKLPERTLDPYTLQKYGVADWRQKFDYKVEGRWSFLPYKERKWSSYFSDRYAYIYYDLHKDTTPPVVGKTITESRTLDSVEVGSESGVPARFYKVGLSWNIEQDLRSALNIAYDVYRDGEHLTAEKPFTPAQTEEKPLLMNIPGRNISFHHTLPRIPPFSPPSEVIPAKFQYVDDRALFGSAVYAVEAVDIHGRYSSDRNPHSHTVQAAVPIPTPNSLRAEIRRREIDGFEVVARWDWPKDHRELAPDWVRFEVFFHEGAHRPALNGAVFWIEKHPSDPTLGKFLMEAFCDSASSPVVLRGLSSSSDKLCLRSTGRTYDVNGISTSSGPRTGVGIINSTITAKTRKGVNAPPTMLAGTRSILLNRSGGTIIKVPFLLLESAESRP